MMDAEILCHVITPAVHMSQYLKMRFGRGMQLLGSVQFLLATVRYIVLHYSTVLKTKLY